MELACSVTLPASQALSHRQDRESLVQLLRALYEEQSVAVKIKLQEERKILAQRLWKKRRKIWVKLHAERKELCRINEEHYAQTLAMQGKEMLKEMLEEWKRVLVEQSDKLLLPLCEHASTEYPVLLKEFLHIALGKIDVHEVTALLVPQQQGEAALSCIAQTPLRQSLLQINPSLSQGEYELQCTTGTLRFSFTEHILSCIKTAQEELHNLLEGKCHEPVM